MVGGVDEAEYLSAPAYGERFLAVGECGLVEMYGWLKLHGGVNECSVD